MKLLRVALTFLLTSLPASNLLADEGGLRLVVQVTVDGLRADLLTRSQDRFGDGGFRLSLVITRQAVE